MKKQKRILCLLLALLALISLLACGEDADPTYFPVENGLSEVNDTPDYDQNHFTILTSYAEKDTDSSIFASDKNPDAVNDELKKRISDVEAALNISIIEQESSTPLSNIEEHSLSGHQQYDLLIVPVADIASALISGNKLTDLNDLSTLDLSLECYNKSFERDMSVGNHLYAVTGDLLIDSKSKISAVLFNNRVAEQIGFEKKYKNINSLVTNGDFTIDFMYDAAEYAKIESESNQSEFPFTGFFADISSVFSFCIGSDNYIFTKNASDVPSISISHTKFFDAYQKISNFDFTDGESQSIDSMFLPCSNQAHPTAENGIQSLFTVATLKDAKRLREEGYCFSILPIPKGSIAQEYYKCHVDANKIECAAILSDVADVTRSATVLDRLFKGSSSILEKRFLEPLKSTCKHDDTDMLQLVLESSTFDLGEMFGWGEFDVALAENLYSNDIKGAFDNNIAIRFEAAEKAMDIVLKRIIGENYKEEASKPSPDQLP